MGARGTIANFGAAVLALVIGGPYWAVIVFLAVALVRVTLDAHVLRRENEFLEERVERLQTLDEDLPSDAPPESGTRLSETFIEKRAS
jgi:hypothetical protein